MSNYRGVVRHVNYWRGAIHRWSTVYQWNGVSGSPPDNAACTLLANADSDFCFGPSPADGGVFECEFYNGTTGGVPIASVVLFDYTDVSAWTGYNGSNWNVTTAPCLTARETSLCVEWAAGLSSSGKPVKLRKWYHSVPDQGTPQAGPDVPSVDHTKLLAAANAFPALLSSYGLILASASGRLAGEASVLTNYGSHQMPKGRKRPALVSASGRTRFPAGLLTVPGSDGSLD